jgi:hypothetical protein
MANGIDAKELIVSCGEAASLLSRGAAAFE